MGILETAKNTLGLVFISIKPCCAIEIATGFFAVFQARSCIKSEGQNLGAIAKTLGRNKSTISHECRCNREALATPSKYAQQRIERRRIPARTGPT